MGDPVTFSTILSPEEREAALLDFQKSAARLVRSGSLTSEQASQMVRTAAQGSRSATKRRDELREFVLLALLAFLDGTLRDGVEVRLCEDRLALHLESVATTLYRAQRSSLRADELRSLFKFGARHFPAVVLGRSDRVTFGPEEDRRRAVVLDVEQAWKFVGGRPRSVPVR